MTQANINIRIDKNLKEQFDNLCEELGVTMSSLINIFIKRAVREQGLPFALSIRDYNKETQKAIEDAEKGIGLHGPFDTVEEMMKSILKDDDEKI